jgi:hypothetical protein
VTFEQWWKRTGQFVRVESSEPADFEIEKAIAKAAWEASPKADERGSAEPVAWLMKSTQSPAVTQVTMVKPDPSYWSAAYWETVPLYNRPDSAQARDAAQAVELMDAEILAFWQAIPTDAEDRDLYEFARAIERTVLAKNGLGGKQ